MRNELLFDTDLERLWYRRPKKIHRRSIARLQSAIGLAGGGRLGLPQAVIDGATSGVADHALEYATHVHENVEAIPRKGRRVILSALILLPSAYGGDRASCRRLAAIFDLAKSGTFAPEIVETLGGCWIERLEVLVNDWSAWDGSSAFTDTVGYGDASSLDDGSGGTVSWSDREPEPTAGSAMEDQATAQSCSEPSQDEILASIRRVVCEDGSPISPRPGSLASARSYVRSKLRGADAAHGAPAMSQDVRVLLNDVPPSEAAGAVDLKRYSGLLGCLPIGAPPIPSTLERLNESYPHFVEVTRGVRQELELALVSGAARFRLAPRLLVGPPGVGKSRYVRALGEALGRPVRFLSAAASDMRALIGTARGWSTAVPSFPLNVMVEVIRADPLLVVDEVEKANRHDGQCGLQAGLLGMMEPSTSTNWYDECLMAHCDLSWVGWMLTANALTGISGPLLDRCRVHHVGGPTPEFFDAYVRTILADIAGELGVPAEQLPTIEPVVYEALRQAFQRNPALRNLKRTLGLVLSVAPRASLH